MIRLLIIAANVASQLLDPATKPEVEQYVPCESMAMYFYEEAANFIDFGVDAAKPDVNCSMEFELNSEGMCFKEMLFTSSLHGPISRPDRFVMTLTPKIDNRFLSPPGLSLSGDGYSFRNFSSVWLDREICDKKITMVLLIKLRVEGSLKSYAPHFQLDQIAVMPITYEIPAPTPAIIWPPEGENNQTAEIVNFNLPLIALEKTLFCHHQVPKSLLSQIIYGLSNIDITGMTGSIIYAVCLLGG